jgi:RNA polymerase sigma-70 factor (ECF subfamily)
MMTNGNVSSNPSEHPTVSTNLLDGVQRMNTESWTRLVTTFGPIVYGWCRASGVPEADAPDLVQNVFGSVARSIQRFEREKPAGSFRSWLATITRNQVRDFFRRERHREAAAGGTEALQQLQAQPDSSPADTFDSTITPESTERALQLRVVELVQSEFEPSTWQAFWRTTVEGRAAADVARELGLSVASVYQARSRILRRIRQCLRELLE